jgi:DNA-binding NarL/FixJ family response regulator
MSEHEAIKESSRLVEITKRLDVIIRMLALLLPEEMTQKDKILLLSSSGLRPREIAFILNTSPNTVSVTLSKLKKTRDRGAPKNQT